MQPLYNSFYVVASIGAWGRKPVSRRVLFRGKVLAKCAFAASVLLVILGAGARSTPFQTELSAKDLALFESKVRPTLEAKCYVCHGPDQQSANLRLDQPISVELAKKVTEVVSYSGEV
ncbi:MAG: hypothetical protein ABL962_21600, partial [Fimbriimonadaceae bacterium]